MSVNVEETAREINNGLARMLTPSNEAMKACRWVKSEVEKALTTALTQNEARVREEEREQLAELEHDQWVAWSKDIAATETITPARRERWDKLWCPYADLTEAQKDQDREWADKVIAIITPKQPL